MQYQLDAEIAEFKPDLIGTTCMFTMTHNSLKAVGQHAARSGIPVMIGGVHVTNDADRVLEEMPEVKIAILREGALVIQNLVKAIRREIGVESLGQIIFCDQGGGSTVWRENANRRRTNSISSPHSRKLRWANCPGSDSSAPTRHFCRRTGLKLADQQGLITEIC